jgi:flagellar export protein FliJ
MFKFNLQTVLDVRIMLEDQSLQEFFEKQKEFQRENERLQSIRLQKNMIVDELHKVQGKPVNVSEIKMDMEYIKQCMKRETLQQEQVKEAEKMTGIKREALLNAIKKRKSMEILKARRFDEHQSHLNLIERTAIDEMALIRHNRKKEK